jgi:methyltransferase (TIGR00027 family)
MESGKPSRTARAAAFHRAARQILEGGRIFTDPLALRVLGIDAETVSREAGERPTGRPMRIFIAARHRFAEDVLANAIQRGAAQVVVLGAGLDTWAYRSPLSDRVRVFEADHPSTQAWKRQCLADAGIALPGSLTFAPIDFERQSLADGLPAAGFDRSAETFFTWLGVVPYLTEDAVWSTLGYIASLPNGAHVVFDYADPPASLSPEMRDAHEKRAVRVAALGESWLSYFAPEDLYAKLRALGFLAIEDLGPRGIASRYLPDRTVSLPERGGHILHAATFASSAACR